MMWQDSMREVHTFPFHVFLKWRERRGTAMAQQNLPRRIIISTADSSGGKEKLSTHQVNKLPERPADGDVVSPGDVFDRRPVAVDAVPPRSKNACCNSPWIWLG